MAEIASAAPSLPFYYYHIPSLTGSTLDMPAFLRDGSQRISNLVGLKYTDTKLFEFRNASNSRMVASTLSGAATKCCWGALATGAKGAIGSTYNVAAPVYQKLIDAFSRGDIIEARRQQALSVLMIRP